MRVPGATSQAASKASNEGKPPPPPTRRRFPELGLEAGHAPPPQAPPAGGPLALHRAPERPAIEALAPAEVVSRMIVGATREGLAEVRLDVSLGSLRGTEVRLVAGPAGLEATFMAATESARRIVEAQLADLARSLEGRGQTVARCEVTMRERPRPNDDRRPRASWEDVVE